MPSFPPAKAGNWELVTNRKHRSKISSSKHITDGAISYFVSGIPPGVSSSDLWSVFQPYGLVCEAFVVKPKDSSSDRFGFVRIQGATNYFALEKTLNEVIFWGQHKLSVKLAKFDRFKNPIVLPPIPRTHSVSGLPPPPPLPIIEPMMRPSIISKPPAPSSSYSNAVSGNTPPPPKKSVIIPQSSAWKPKTCRMSSLWGVCLNLNSLMNAKRILLAEGLNNFEFFHLGGLDTLLTFPTAKEASEFLANGPSTWRLVFESLSLWEGKSIPFSRIICLNIHGVPIMARDEVTYNKIGESIGKLVCPSDFSWKDEDVSFGRVFIISDQRRIIDEEVSVFWRHETFMAWVTEESFSPWHNTSEAVSDYDFDNSDSDFISSDFDLEDGEIEPSPEIFESAGDDIETTDNGQDKVDLVGDNQDVRTEKVIDITHEIVLPAPMPSEKGVPLSSPFVNPSALFNEDFMCDSFDLFPDPLDPMPSSPLGCLNPGPNSRDLDNGPLPPLHVFGSFPSSGPSGPSSAPDLRFVVSPPDVGVSSQTETATSLPLIKRNPKKGKRGKSGHSSSSNFPLFGGYKSTIRNNALKSNLSSSTSRKSVGSSNVKPSIIQPEPPLSSEQQNLLLASEVGDLLGFNRDPSFLLKGTASVIDSTIGYP
ncbi:hypothetical protein SSX86_002372 [Deinandra increscens subsp. villosa]|uniref:RRM domain-containing protein n=1 Tax=Deinandra increscens subsp. villosa TaxID=3103831 RepID=A0AAP0HD34_9ASTR